MDKMMKSRIKHTQEGYEATVIRSIEEIEDIRSIWEKMLENEPAPVINADIDRYISVIKASGGDAQPYIILMKQNGQPVVMVIGRVSRQSLELKFGYKTLLRPTLNFLTIVYGGIIGQLTSDLSALLILELMKVLRRRKVDIVFFNHLKTDSHIYQLSRKIPGVLSRCYFPKIEPHWVMSVPATTDQLYQRFPPKHRSNLRRLIRRLERAYSGQVEVVIYKTEDQVGRAVKAMADISAQTYQRELGAGIVDTKQTRDMLKLAAKQGWLRACVLFIDGEPAAFELALRYCRAYFGLSTGFDPKWRKYRVGTVVLLRFLETICAEKAAERFDFGFGDAEYKRSYGNEHWNEASICIFAARFYPIFINLVQMFMMGLSVGIERILRRVGFLGWVKRRWRNLLQRSDTR